MAGDAPIALDTEIATIDGSPERPLETIMKYLRYIVVVLIVLAIFSVVTHFYRESIARHFANLALREQGFNAIELSIQTLGVDYVRLSHLILEEDDGTRYEVSGLSFPLSFPSVRPEEILIEQLDLVPAATVGTLPLADLLQSLLSLPDSVPNTSITVSRFTMPNAPTVENVVWRSVEHRQHLAFSAQSVEVDVDVDRMNDDHHQVTVNAFAGGIPDAFSSTLDIHCCNTGFLIDGKLSIELPPWLVVLQSIGLLPDRVASINARLDGQVRIDVDDETQSAVANAHFSLMEKMPADDSDVGGSGVRLQANSSDPIRFSFEYPSLEWTADVGQIDMFAQIEPVGDVSIQLTDFECGSGVQCSTHASLETGPLQLGTIALARARSSATLAIAGDETTRVDISSDFTLDLSGIESQSFSVESIRVARFSGSQLTVGDGVWHADVDQMELVLDAFADRDGMVASLPIAFSNLQVRDRGATVATNVSLSPKAASVSWPDSTIVLPGVRGSISLQENEVTASSVIFDDEGTLSAHVYASHNVATGEGSISIDDATLLFDVGELSGHFSKWPYAWDVVSGTLSSEFEANWKPGSTGTEYDAIMAYRADALAGNYNDIVFSGLNTELAGSLNPEAGMTLSPSAITVAFLDVGVPVEQIVADFSVNVAEEAVQVHEVSMSAFGGQFVVDPFQFSMLKESNNLILRPKSIQLQFMLDLAEFEDIELSGSISGELQLTVRKEKITITNGRLESDPPRRRYSLFTW